MIIQDESVLRKSCDDATIFEAQNIVSQLEGELSSSTQPGIGLSANQIGIHKRVCIVRLGNYHINLANPEITETHDLMLFRNEGCLSYPDQLIHTKRYNEILVKDLFHPNGVVYTGILSVVVQHEISHTNGETMWDYRVEVPAGPNMSCWCGSGKKYKKCHKGKEILVDLR